MKQIFKPVSLALIAFSAWITWVCSTLLHFDDSGNLIAHSYAVWGDWSAHFTFINALRERGFHWLAGDNPLFPGIPFQYPFLSHVLTYLFSRITFMGTIHATYLLSLILIFILPFALFTALRKLGLTAWSSFASALAFLLMGGFQWMDSSLKATDPLTNQFDQASVVTQFILFEFFPQRAFLFGILILLSCAIYALQNKKWTMKSKLGLGLVIALAGLTHVHTWITLGTILLFLFIFYPFEPKKHTRRDLFIFAAGVAALSAGFLGFLLMRGNASSTRPAWDIWFPGWAQNPKANIARAQNMNFLVFWLFNTGFYLPLAIWGIGLKRKEKKLWAIAGSGLFIFAVADLFNIQPYYYDNLKLFTYAFLLLAPFVGFALEAIAKFAKLPKYIGPAICVILVSCQIYSAASDLKMFSDGAQSALFFSPQEFEMANHFKELRTSAEDIVLISPRHNHWLPCLTGNPVAMGYPGWLWSWGISYGEREKEINGVLLGEPTADQIIHRLNIRYAALQHGEKAGNKEVNFTYFDSHFKRVLESSNWVIYSLNDLPISPSPSVR